MPVLFEKFVCNFYRHEAPGWSVKRDDIAWTLTPLTPSAADYLPKMQTDISLRDHGRTVIIDTEFYAKALVSRYDDGAEKLRPAHLYQLTAYLRNIAARGGQDLHAAGVLLYPEVKPLPWMQYEAEGHRLTATGVDLSKDWRTIHNRLLEIVATASSLRMQCVGVSRRDMETPEEQPVIQRKVHRREALCLMPMLWLVGDSLRRTRDISPAGCVRATLHVRHRYTGTCRPSRIRDCATSIAAQPSSLSARVRG